MSEIQPGDHVFFKKTKCCGRKGWEWRPGTVKSTRKFGEHFIYLVWGYARWVKAEDIKKQSKAE